jgi:hypothetical protein
MSMIGEMSLEDAARQAAGNWKSWTSFVWFRETEIGDPESWSIAYTHHRDSGLLARSNAGAIAGALEPFTTGDDADVVLESHSHWAVGHVDGFSIRVYRGGEITAAFRTYHRLLERLAEYPILDEDDYSSREYEAALDNLVDASRRLEGRYQLPDGWEGEAYSWLSDHRPGGVENRDDHGGCPSGRDLRDAFEALGYGRAGG